MVQLSCGCYVDIKAHSGYYYIIVRSPEGDRQIEIHSRTNICEDEPLIEHISEIKEVLNEVLAIIAKNHPQVEKSKSDSCSADPEKKVPETNCSINIENIVNSMELLPNRFNMVYIRHKELPKTRFRSSGRSPPMRIGNLFYRR